ncbi:hypothetical protein MCETHM1_03444 [Flavobacteriaceae bacterium]
MIIAILGATGLTGNLCLHYLLNEPTFTKIIAIGRKSTGIQHEKLAEVLLVNNQLYEPVVADVLISCMGTTIKKAGSADLFEAIDFTLPLYLAKELWNQGCSSATIISAVGANPFSRFLYTKTKGKMEIEMGKIGFKSLSIIRPSFIVGDRKEKRNGEVGAIALLKFLKPLLKGELSKYKVLSADDIAKALVFCSIHNKPGKKIYYHDHIKKILMTQELS